ncbi:hypothetical protein MHYP_G00096940 [Metynnis hypsauchen]
MPFWWSFPSSHTGLIIDGFSNAAEPETQAIDWPRNRHGFLPKVVKNLPRLIAKQFLGAWRRGGGVKKDELRIPIIDIEINVRSSELHSFGQTPIRHLALASALMEG